MDTLLKILFGVLLGVVGVLAWNWHESNEAAKRGLVPGWVPADAEENEAQVMTTSRAKKNSPVTKPMEKNYTDTVFGRRMGSSSTSNNNATAKPSDAEKITFPALAAQPSRWPKNVKLAKPVTIPLQEDGKKIGEISFTSGETLELLRVQANGMLQVRAKGQTFFVPGESTNVRDAVTPVTSVRTSAKTKPPSPSPAQPETVTASSRSWRPSPASSGETTAFGSKEQPENSTTRARYR